MGGEAGAAALAAASAAASVITFSKEAQAARKESIAGEEEVAGERAENRGPPIAALSEALRAAPSLAQCCSSSVGKWLAAGSALLAAPKDDSAEESSQHRASFQAPAQVDKGV